MSTANRTDEGNEMDSERSQTRTQLAKWESEISQFADQMRKRLVDLKQSFRRDQFTTQRRPGAQQDALKSPFDDPNNIPSVLGEHPASEFSSDVADAPNRLAQLKQRLAMRIEQSQFPEAPPATINDFVDQPNE